MTHAGVTHARCIYVSRVFFAIMWLSVSEGSKHKPFFNHSQSTRSYEEMVASIRGTYNYSQYQSYSSIVKQLKRIALTDDKFLKRTLFSIGKTFEKRTLWAIKFHDVSGGKTSKKTIVVDCGAHAREWIAPSTCMYIINELISDAGTLKKVLKKYDWVIIPLLNPDGYVYSRKSKKTRFWRKNRSYDKKQLKKFKETKNPLCIGVDINRNFNKTWGGVGAPTNHPCGETYAGSKPFSERESFALAKYLRSVEKDVVTYVTLHCYGQLWMTPYAYTAKRPGEYKEMKRVAKMAVRKMKEGSGVEYKVGSAHDILYPHSGSSADWVYSKLDIPYSYLIEMVPKNDSSGRFDLPDEIMVKNAKEITVGLLTMALNIKEGKTKSYSRALK